MADGTDFQKMVELLEGMRDDMKDFRKGYQTMNPPNSSSNVNFNVNGGGIGFRVAINLCVIMFVLLICSVGFSIYTAQQQSARISEIRKDTRDDLSKMKESTDRMQDYLNIILQWSPELRAKINKEGSKK